MKLRSGFFLVLVIVCLLVCTSPAYPQGTTAAQLTGTVLDESGGSVKGASLTLRDPDTGRSYQTTSNDSGYYALPNIPPGHYALTTSFKAFATSVHKDINLTVGESATINVTLKVATVGEQVVVTTEAPVIEPTKTEISQVIGTQEINTLPTSTRLFTDFALLTPGVATGRTSLQSTITEFEVTRVSFGGMRDLSNLVTVDGADNINTATGSQRSTPPQEAVAEFRVVNSSFGAEYGRALGGIVNIVTKSGTNDFHGDVYDYLQNNATNARSLLQPAPDAYVLRQNQFGIAAGGPIKKDKIFFFTNYEGQRRAESPTFPEILTAPVNVFSNTPPFAPTVPTTNLDLIDAAKEAIGLAPEGCNVPLPQCPPGLTNHQLLNSVLKTKDNDYGIIKIDDQVTTNNHLTLRYNIEDGRDLNQLVGSTLDGGGIGAPSSGHDVFLRDQSLVGTVATTIDPNLVNTVLVQYARRHYNFPGVTGQPNLDIPNTLLFGHNFGVLDAIYESRLQVSDALSWVKGNHVAKFGADFNYVDNFVIWPGFTPMRIVLPNINCLVDFVNFVNPTADIPSAPANGPCPLASPPAFFPPQPGPNPNDPLSGVPIAFWGAPVGMVQPDMNGQLLPTPPPIPITWTNAYLPSETINFSETLAHKYYGFFAQDTWRIRHDLTLNYGLRYDYEQGLWKQINPHYLGFQPRLGVAWSPNSKTVVRAGFGLFDDRYNLSFLFITQPQRPVILPGETVRGIRKRSELATWVLNQFTPGPLGLPSMAAATLVTKGQVPDQFITGSCPPSCTAGDGLVDPHSPIPYSEQANLEIDREIANGLTVSAGYMFVAAHHLVRAANLNVCPPFPFGTSEPQITVPFITPGNPSCIPAPAPPPGWPADKAFFGASGLPQGGPAYNNAGLLYYTDNSGNSVYNGLTLQVTERFRKNFSLDANYTFSHTLDDGTFTTFVSTPQDLYDRSLERANSNQDVRHRFITNFTATAPEDSFLRHFQLSSIITLQSGRPFTEFVGFDANGDTNPVTDRVGDLGRNTYYGDHLYAWDLRIARYFQLRERLRLDLSVDAFNLLNRPNVDEVTSVYGAAVICGGTATPKNYKDRATIETQQQAIAFADGTGGPTCPILAPVPSPPVPNALFGTPRTVLNPRQFQFGAKFSF